MTTEEEIKLYRIVEDRLSALYEELDPKGPLDFMGRYLVKERWKSYIAGLDMKFTGLRSYSDSSRVRISNPLYTEDEELQIIEMDAGAADKILILGMP